MELLTSIRSRLANSSRPQPGAPGVGACLLRSAAVVLIGWFGALSTGLGSGTAYAESNVRAEVSSEYSVKAAFLYNFARYVKWPKSALDAKNEPLVIAVLGKNPFGKILEEAFHDKRIGSHPLQVKYFADRAALRDCHILFVPASEESEIEKLRERYAKQAVLLVSESISAARQGAQVGFYLENSKVRFAINEVAARQARLEVSSELLKLAKLVEPDRTVLE